LEAMNTSVATIDQLTRRFKETTAVNQVRVKVHAGEIFGFLGHNGAVKTTPVRLPKA
jgi:ABC-2 type transport system ATP-binding protein